METIHRLSHRLFTISDLRSSNTFRFSQLPPAVSLKHPFELPARSPAPKIRRRFSNGAVDFRAPLRVSAGWFSGLGAKKKEVLPEIVKAGDPVLHEPASEVPVEEIGSERIQKIIDDMIGVMRKAPGVGLAAPQIGIPLKSLSLRRSF